MVTPIRPSIGSLYIPIPLQRPRTAETDVPGDPDDLSIRGQRDQGLVITMVDLGEVGDLVASQPLDRRQESVARLFAEMLDVAQEGFPILGRDQPHQEIGSISRPDVLSLLGFHS